MGKLILYIHCTCIFRSKKWKKWKRTKYWQRKSKNREQQMKNNTSMSEEAKVGVVDEAIAIDLSSGEKVESRREGICNNLES